MIGQIIKPSIFIICLTYTLTCIGQDGKIPITTFSEQARAAYQKAVVLQGQLQIEEADKAYIEALSIDSTFVLAHLRLAMLKDEFARR